MIGLPCRSSMASTVLSKVIRLIVESPFGCRTLPSDRERRSLIDEIVDSREIKNTSKNTSLCACTLATDTQFRSVLGVSPKQLHSKLVDASRSRACDLTVLWRVHVTHRNIPLGVIERIERFQPELHA